MDEYHCLHYILPADWYNLRCLFYLSLGSWIYHPQSMPIQSVTVDTMVLDKRWLWYIFRVLAIPMLTNSCQVPCDHILTFCKLPNQLPQNVNGEDSREGWISLGYVSRTYASFPRPSVLTSCQPLAQDLALSLTCIAPLYNLPDPPSLMHPLWLILLVNPPWLTLCFLCILPNSCTKLLPNPQWA